MNINHKYFWLVGNNINNFTVNDLIKNRYKIINERICQDIQPENEPFLTGKIPRFILPYNKLFSYRLHLPIIYDAFLLDKSKIAILDNVPLNKNGELYPSIIESWPHAQPLQQIYWLWQILELWTPLQQEGVAESLLILNNLRIDGWRIRLVELFTNNNCSLQDLGNSWENLAVLSQNHLSSSLEFVIHELKKEGYPLHIIKEFINDKLLVETSKLPLRTKIFSLSDKGKRRDHNEDYYYPTQLDLYVLPVNYNQNLSNNLMMICDGMGGHESGEVASYLAIESLKLQLKMFLAEISKTEEILAPEIVKENLATMIRVTNNLLFSRNQNEGKEAKGMMGTTLILALQLPQFAIEGNPHEVYIANIGDSRAYWITSNSCQQLNIDDDICTRWIKSGKYIYRQALKQRFSGKLTQALGIEDSSYLEPSIQRFMLIEDGILLLCSDGLSDYNFLENNWQKFFPDVLQGEISLQIALQSLLQLTNETTGHDNITIVATFYGVSPQESVVINFTNLETNSAIEEIPDDFALVLAANSVSEIPPPPLEDNFIAETVITKSANFSGKWLLWLLFSLIMGVSSFMVTQWKLQPSSTPPLINDINMQK